MRLICRVWVCGAPACGLRGLRLGPRGAGRLQAARGHRFPQGHDHQRRHADGGGAVLAQVPGWEKAADHHHVSRLGRNGGQTAAGRARLCAGRIPGGRVRLPRLGCERSPRPAGETGARGQGQGPFQRRSHGSARSRRSAGSEHRSAQRHSLGAWRAAMRHGAYWTLGIELRRWACRLRRRPRPPRQGPRQPGSRLGFAFCRANTGGPEENLQ